MAEPDLRSRADARYERALADAGARDPRDFYRKLVRELKERDRDAYHRAVTYYEGTLLPAVVREDSDPLGEWVEYGRVLAALTVPGRTVQVDPSGRARDYARPVPPDALVLHLPEDGAGPALVIGIPPRLSPAQRATNRLLVQQLSGD